MVLQDDRILFEGKSYYYGFMGVARYYYPVTIQRQEYNNIVNELNIFGTVNFGC